MYILNKFSSETYLSITIMLLPISYVIGNFALNTNIILLILFSFFIKKFRLYCKNLNFKVKILIYFIIFYFGVFNYFVTNVDYWSLKSIFYLRFLILILIINFFFKFHKKKLVTIFNFYFIFSLLVSIDTLIQYFYGKDLLGYSKIYDYGRLTGPFGEEAIVGFYLFVFSIITYVFLQLNNSKLSKYKNIYIIIIFSTCLLTGERNTVLMIAIFLFISLIVGNIKKINLLTIILSLFIVYIFFISNDEILKKKYSLSSIPSYNQKSDLFSLKDKGSSYEFNNNIYNIEFFFNKFKQSPWGHHYYAAVHINSNHFLFGSGFRTYREVCKNDEIFIKNKSLLCSTHPHNIYLELFSDLGLFGLCLFLTIFLSTGIMFYKSIFFSNKIAMTYALFVFTIFFPFKPHGSLFNSNYAFILWFVFALFLTLLSFRKNNEL